MMRKLLLSASFGMAGFAATATGSAAVVTTAGTDASNFSGWRSTSVTKTLDVKGNDAYGNDGYVLFYTREATYSSSFLQNSGGNPLNYSQSNSPAQSATTLKSIPAFMTITNVSMNWAGLSASYPNVDNPTQPIASTVSDVKSGFAGSSSSRSVNFVDLSFNQDLAAGIRFGLVARSSGNDALTTVRLTQTVGGTATAEYTAAVSGTDGNTIYFFDITGIKSGDTFRLYGAKPAVGNVNALAVGMTIDAIPEPMGLSLLAVSGMAFVRRSRRF